MKGVGEPQVCSLQGINVSNEEHRGKDRQRLRETACPLATRAEAWEGAGEAVSCQGLSPDLQAVCVLSSSPVEKPSAQARTMPPAACLTCGQTRS